MITEDYVSFETAKLLKEKGFDNDVLITDWWYDDSGISHKRGNYSYSGAPLYNKETCFNCPTIQLAMKWLREVYSKSIEIRSQGLKATSIGWIVEIYNLANQDEEFHHPYTFPTYEEACEAAIRYCLENLI